MSISEVDETNSVLLDEERRQASHQEVKASIDDDINARIKRESARVEPKESEALAGVAHQMQEKSVHQAAQTEREVGRGRVAARASQVVDYLFYIIYGLIALQFTLRLIGARPGSGFTQLIASLSQPLLAPFERIVATPSSGSYHIEFSYLLALVVYILIHVAISAAFRLVAHRKVTV
jgi:uncharacterized protein YggT (Ycf19 family)